MHWAKPSAQIWFLFVFWIKSQVALIESGDGDAGSAGSSNAAASVAALKMSSQLLSVWHAVVDSFCDIAVRRNEDSAENMARMKLESKFWAATASST